MKTKMIRRTASPSFLQTRRAYQAHFGQAIPSGTSYQAAADELVKALGLDAAIVLLTSQSNDPAADEIYGGETPAGVEMEGE
jgi:hypothetical protein